MTWSYDVTTLATNQKNALRFLIGDTNTHDQQLADEELAFALVQGGSLVGAAVVACQSLATAYSRKADTVTGELRTTWSSQARAYAARAQEFQIQMTEVAFVSPYAGGISRSDKLTRELDIDRVRPSFERGLTDNLNQPVSPAGDDASVTDG